MSDPNTTRPPKLLVSICNVAVNPQPTCLLSLDMATGRRRWVDVGVGEALVTGTGITADDRFVYHLSVTQAGFHTKLTVFDRNSLSVVRVMAMPEVADAHSIVKLGGELCVASSETDEVIAYPCDDGRIGPARVLWTPTASGSDTHHVNSLAVLDGDLLCTAFGPRQGESWSTATDGYLLNLTTGEVLVGGLRQPHTVATREGRVFFCNSLFGTVNCAEEGANEVDAFLSGYSRGLAFGPDGAMYAGTSLGRRPIHDPFRTDEFGSPGSTGELHGRCAVVHFSPEGFRTEIGLAPMGAEIYDLVVL